MRDATSINGIAMLLSFAMLFVASSAHAQPLKEKLLDVKLKDAPKAAKELLLTVAARREKLIQYVVKCDVTGRLGALPYMGKSLSSDNTSKFEVYLEYSALNNHFVAAAVNRNAPASKWSVFGTSVNLGLTARNGSALQVVHLDSKQQKNFGHLAPTQTRLGIFDPRAIGLGYCSEFLSGVSFEEIMAGHLNATSKQEVLIEGDKAYFRESETTVVFDTARDYWPVEFYSYTGYHWYVELGKVGDCYVPVHSTQTCSPKKGQEMRTDITFHWTSVNKVFPTGQESIARLTKVLELATK